MVLLRFSSIFLCGFLVFVKISYGFSVFAEISSGFSVPVTPLTPPLNEFPFTRAILWTRSVYSRIEHEIEIVLDYKIVHPSFIYILWQKTNTQSAKYWFPVWKTGTKKYTYIITPYEFISFYSRRTSLTIYIHYKLFLQSLTQTNITAFINIHIIYLRVKRIRKGYII